MFSLFSLVLFFYALNFVSTEILYLDCGSKLGTVQSIDVSGCTSSPCMLTKGTTYTINIRFQANVPSQATSVSVYGLVYGIPTPVPLPISDACKLGAKCPIGQNDVNTLSISLPILSVYPSISLDIKLQITATDLNENFVCVQAPVQITSS